MGMVKGVRQLCLGHWSDEGARAKFLARWLELKQSQGWPVAKRAGLVAYHEIGDEKLSIGVIAPFTRMILGLFRMLFGAAKHPPYGVCCADKANAQVLLGASTVHINVAVSVDALTDMMAQVQKEIAAFHPDPKLVSYVLCVEGGELCYLTQGSDKPKRATLASFVLEVEQKLGVG